MEAEDTLAYLLTPGEFDPDPEPAPAPAEPPQAPAAVEIAGPTRDEEIEALRRDFILADESEDDAIHRLAKEFRDLRSLYVGNLYMDEGQKHRFQTLSSK